MANMLISKSLGLLIAFGLGCEVAQANELSFNLAPRSTDQATGKLLIGSAN